MANTIESHFELSKQYDLSKLAYAAGYFDGEGTVHAQNINGRSISFRIQINSADYWALSVFAELFGGEVRQMSSQTATGKKYCCSIYIWYRINANALEPMRAMLPFLRAKHHEVKAILDSGMILYRSGTRSITEEQIQIRQNLVATLKSLKRTGRQFDHPPA